MAVADTLSFHMASNRIMEQQFVRVESDDEENELRIHVVKK
jgi:hypothetical protein